MPGLYLTCHQTISNNIFFDVLVNTHDHGDLYKASFRGCRVGATLCHYVQHDYRLHRLSSLSLPGRLWRWSGEFLQARYDQVLEACGQDGSLAFLHGGWTHKLNSIPKDFFL